MSDPTGRHAADPADEAPEPEEHSAAPSSLRDAVWLPFLGFLAREIRRTRDLTMGKNHGIDPIPTAHAMPIERSDFEHFFRNHEAVATMAAVASPLLSDDE